MMEKIEFRVFEIVDEMDVEDALTKVMKRYSDRPKMESGRVLEEGTYRDMYNIFLDDDRRGCYISVKVPSEARETGKALHLNVRHMFDPEKNVSVNVYPTEKSGRGKFWSKSIHRTASKTGKTSWKDRLVKEASKGLDLCMDRFEGSTGIEGRVQDFLEDGKEGDPYYFEKYQSGSYYRGYCNTKEKWQQEKNTCKNVEAYRADDFESGLKHYITIPKENVKNFDDIEMSQVYILPSDACDRNIRVSRMGSPYRNCKIQRPAHLAPL